MEVQFAAMGQEPYHHVLFNGSNMPSARNQARARTLAGWRSDSSEKVLKVVDTDHGEELIKFGKWNVYLHERPKSVWDQHMQVD